MSILYIHHRARPCRKNRYDQQDEYLVVVKEHGQREQEESQEELRRSTEKLEAVILLGKPFAFRATSDDQQESHPNILKPDYFFKIGGFIPDQPDPKGSSEADHFCRCL